MGVDVKPEQFAAQRVPERTLAQAAGAGVENAYHAASNAATMARVFSCTVCGVSPGLYMAEPRPKPSALAAIQSAKLSG